MMNSPEELAKTSLSRQDLERFARNSIDFFGLDTSRISSMFIAQILQLGSTRTIGTHNILNEVKHLEGLSNRTATGKSKKFKRGLLVGLNKKHFFDARFIVKNIGSHFGARSGGNARLDKIINEAFSRNASGYVDDDFVAFIAHHTTIGAFDERAKKSLTGEWIVYQEYEGKNFYLTLAAHDEGDERIYRRVCDCYDLDFEFLRLSPSQGE